MLDKNKISYLSLIVIIFASAFLTYHIKGTISSFSPSYPRYSNIPTIENCIAGIENGVGIELEIMKEAINTCYSRSYHQGLLNSFHMRAAVFEHQSVADKVIMWMVVALTLSGVSLSAAQLFASYKLSSLFQKDVMNHASEIGAEQGRIVLKSSTVGLAVLVISLLFFYVYVIYVYTIHEPRGGEAGYEQSGGGAAAKASSMPLSYVTITQPFRDPNGGTASAIGRIGVGTTSPETGTEAERTNPSEQNPPRSD